MHVDVRARHLEVSQALHEHLVRRLRFALGRVAHRIERVQVRLEDVNGPRGGVDKRCSIAVAGVRGWVAVVEERDADAYVAVAGAAARAARAVERASARAAEGRWSIRDRR